MKKEYLLAKLFMLAVCATAVSQMLPGTYKTTWVGNTYGLGLSSDRQNGKWVQDIISGACVGPNGMVYTTSEWDEGGRSSGIYGGKVVNGNEIGNVYGSMATGNCVGETGRVGKESCANGMGVAANSNNSFAVFNGKIYKYSLQGCNGTEFIGHDATAMSATDTRLLTVNGNTVQLYDLSNANELKNFTVANAGPCAIAPNGDCWILSGVKVGNMYGRNNSNWIKIAGVEPEIRHYNASGNYLNSIVNPSGQSTWWPTHISFDNNGKLLVSDAGYRRQILSFNTSNLSLENAFGQLGGISAGVPGVNASDKFYGQIQAGTDANGNLYVICEGMGPVIRKFNSSRKLVWQLTGLGFVESADADVTTDGADVYTPNEHYKLDYSKTAAGTEWSPYAYTMDRIANPSDPRVTAWRNSAIVRTISGKRILFVYTMAGGAAMDFYKFNDEIAVYTGSFDPGSWAGCPDKNADIWYVNNNTIYKKNFTGFDGSGNPTWAAGQSISNNPGSIGHIERIEYFPDEDILYLVGDIPSGDWGIIGTKMEKWNHWMNKTGSRTKAWSATIPYAQTNEVPGKIRQKAICFSGDYIFSVGVETRCKVWIYKATDGSIAGYLDPGPEVNGAGSTGWVDIPMGIRSMKRSNGEYVVLIEEDGFSKVLMFRWCPSGNCVLSTATQDLKQGYSFSVYPNPSEQVSTVRYSLSETSSVKITVYSAIGSKVMQEMKEQQITGEHEANLNISALEAGVYFVKMEVNGKQLTQKLFITK